MSQKRQRTDSAREERNVTDFVEATTSYDSNISFVAASAAGKVTKFVLLVGTEEQLKAPEVAKLPFYSDAVAEAIADASEGKLFATYSKGHHVNIGKVTTVASRHNCPTRPDVITNLVKAALGDGKVTALDIFARSADELAVATAVAKGATFPFTAKKGAGEKASYKPETPAIRVIFPGVLKNAASELKILADSIQLSQRLVEAPTNLVDTVTFAEIASILGKKYGFDVDIIQGEELREKGYGGLYGVGKAAEFPPALVTLTYKPKAGITPKQKIALVGKGIVYDTGGLAIKTPTTFMCGMKRDMGGSAAVFGGFISAVRLNVDSVVSCTLCLADNAIGPRSQRNDDIVLMKSGVSVEINNTDAEGRLALGDGVYHASKLLSFTPDVIIDMATLTGAQLIGVGKKHAAIYTASEEWEAKMTAAGKATGDTCHPIVYAPEYHNPLFASKIADYKNLMNVTTDAGISCAGSFIANNLSPDYKGEFVHVDLAGPIFDNDGATGYGVALLTKVFGKF